MPICDGNTDGSIQTNNIYPKSTIIMVLQLKVLLSAKWALGIHCLHTLQSRRCHNTHQILLQQAPMSESNDAMASDDNKWRYNIASGYSYLACKTSHLCECTSRLPKSSTKVPFMASVNILFIFLCIPTAHCGSLAILCHGTWDLRGTNPVVIQSTFHSDVFQ